MIYAMVTKVVKPAIISVFTVVPCSDSLNNFSSNPPLEGVPSVSTGCALLIIFPCYVSALPIIHL